MRYRVIDFMRELFTFVTNAVVTRSRLSLHRRETFSSDFNLVLGARLALRSRPVDLVVREHPIDPVLSNHLYRSIGILLPLNGSENFPSILISLSCTRAIDTGRRECYSRSVISFFEYQCPFTSHLTVHVQSKSIIMRRWEKFQIFRSSRKADHVFNGILHVNPININERAALHSAANGD